MTVAFLTPVTEENQDKDKIIRFKLFVEHGLAQGLEPNCKINIPQTQGCPLLNLPWTSSSSSVRSMTEPLGLVAAGLPLEGVDPAAWLSNNRDAKKTN